MDKETKEYLQNKIIQDIEEMADDVSIFLDEDEKRTPRQVIIDLKVFAMKHGVDFWAIVKSNRTKYENKRLTYIYEKNTMDFEDSDFYDLNQK